MTIANAASQPAATAELHVMAQSPYRTINGKSLADVTICDAWDAERVSQAYASDFNYLVAGAAERNLLITCYGAAHCLNNGDVLTCGVLNEYLFSSDVEEQALNFYYEITSVTAPELNDEGGWA